MENKIEWNARTVMALALAFLVGFAPASYAADAHIFRNPTTGAPVGASVDTTGKFQGDGSALTSVTATPSGAAGGDLSGTYPNPTIGAGKVTTAKLSADAVTSVKILDLTIGDAKINFNYAGSSSKGGAATTATSLAANGSNCTTNQFNKGVDASGNAESCATLLDADVPNTITIDLSATATALAANGANAASGRICLGVDASGACEEGQVDASAVNASTAPVQSNALFDHSANASAHHTQTTTLAHSALTGVTANQHHTPTVDTFVTNKDAHDHLGGDGATILHSSLGSVGPNDHHAPTVDTNAGTVCTGTTTYLDGGGVCDDISSVYQAADAQLTALSAHYQGKDTQANICTKVPGAAGNFVTQSDSPYQMWTATGTLVGQWIGMFNGLGPC